MKAIVVYHKPTDRYLATYPDNFHNLSKYQCIFDDEASGKYNYLSGKFGSCDPFLIGSLKSAWQDWSDIQKSEYFFPMLFSNTYGGKRAVYKFFRSKFREKKGAILHHNLNVQSVPYIRVKPNQVTPNHVVPMMTDDDIWKMIVNDIEVRCYDFIKNTYTVIPWSELLPDKISPLVRTVP